MQLYNLEGQAVEVIPDGSPVPSGRWGSLQDLANYRYINGYANLPGLPSATIAGPAPASPRTNTNPTISMSGGFGNLIQNGTAGGTTGGTGTDTAGPTPTAGAGAGPQLMQMWIAQGGDPTNSQAYNDWTGRVMQQFGVSTWEALPSDFATRYNPTGNAPHPVGYTPPPPTTTGGVAQATAQGGGNYNQNQNANQTGQFNTTGTTNNTQNQTSGGTQNQTTSGSTNTTQNTTGTQTGTIGNVGSSTSTQTGTIGNVGNTVNTQTGTQNTTTGQNTTATGTTTSRPIDTLGFGGLIQNAATGAQATDAQRNAFLRDVIATGGSGFNSQVEQAVRGSLTGPQMTGAGNSAQARAAGYAGAQVARNNMGERLAAAGQLVGPTALTNLAGAAQPYIGQEQTTSGSTSATGFNNLVNNLTNATASNNTQTQNLQNASTSNNTQTQNLANTSNTTGTQNTTGSSNTATTGFNNLVASGKETTDGTAKGASSSAAAGNIPQAHQVSTGGGGGCVLCTAGVELGLWRNLRVLRRVIDYKLNTARDVYTPAARGYFFLFTPLAAWLLGHARIAAWLAPLARAVVYQELRLSGRRLPRRLWASFVHDTGHWLCHWVGKLPFLPGRVISPEIERIARKNNIWFQLQ